MYERWLGAKRIQGFEVLTRECRDEFGVPFADHVVLVQRSAEDALRLPFLDHHCLPMAVGIELHHDRLKAGSMGQVTITQRALLPRFGQGKEGRCYELKETVVGGFTSAFRFQHSAQVK